MSPAIVITIGQIKAGQVPPEELLRMAKSYRLRNQAVELAHSPVYDEDPPASYAKWLRERFPLSSVGPREDQARKCEKIYNELKGSQMPVCCSAGAAKRTINTGLKQRGD